MIKGEGKPHRALSELGALMRDIAACRGDLLRRETAVAEARVQDRAVVARLEGCDDRDAAAAYRGKSVAVPRAALPRTQSGEYYWADLIGLKVANTAGQDLGQVTGMLQTGANDVLVVAGERERLIPFIAEVIREVDPAAGIVRVEWGADY